MGNNILIIDDDPSFLKWMKKFLEAYDYQVEICHTPAKALEIFNKHPFDCVFLDVKMPGTEGLVLLKQFRQEKPAIPVVMISGSSNISKAVEAIRLGAFDFVEKGEKPEHLLVVLKNALEKHQLELEKNNLKSQLSESFPIIGENKELKKILQRLPAIAKSNAKVLITGETGTGKELIARALYYHSDRLGKPFIKINCAAIPHSLLESELFGYKKGAFTGAHSDYQGKFIAADSGTLFLDEISEMPMDLQAKLLRVLESGEVEVLGRNKPIKIDVRFISATNKDMQQLVRDKTFREDLYHRLNVIHIHLPPLRERKDDIPLLLDYYLNEFSQTYGKPVVKLSKKSLAYLRSYPWPGNIRELKNFAEKLIILGDQELLNSENIEFFLEPTLTSKSNFIKYDGGKLKEALEKFEKDYIEDCLRQNDFKILETANSLGINRSVLFRKMQKYGIKKEAY